MSLSAGYTLLGLKPSTTTISKVRAAYRNNALRFHPDKSSDPRANEIMGSITDAYKLVLKHVSVDADRSQTYSRDTSRQPPRVLRAEALKEPFRISSLRHKASEILLSTTRLYQSNRCSNEHPEANLRAFNALGEASSCLQAFRLHNSRQIQAVR